MTRLTVDGVVRRWNPPTTQVRVADPTKLPVGEAKECAVLDWYELLLADDDFPDTVPARLAT